MKYSKDELIAMTDVEVDKLRVEKFKRIFITAATTLGIIGAATALGQVLPPGSEIMNSISRIAMIANALIVPVNLKNVFTAVAAKKAMEETVEHLKEDRIDEEKYFNNFVMQTAGILKMSFDDLKQEADERMKRGM